VLTIDKDLDLTGHGLTNVKFVQGLNWQLNENGDLITRGKIVAEGNVETKGVFKNILKVMQAALAAIEDQISATYSYVAQESKLDKTVQDDGTVDFDLFGLVSSRGEIVISGSAQLTQGEAVINFDASFTSVISSTTPLKIFLTAEVPFQGQLYVAEKSIYGFKVKESIYTESGAFNWQVIARRAGYEKENETQMNTQASIINSQIAPPSNQTTSTPSVNTGDTTSNSTTSEPAINTNVEPTATSSTGTLPSAETSTSSEPVPVSEPLVTTEVTTNSSTTSEPTVTSESEPAPTDNASSTEPAI
jgi:hypothetical protein